MDVVDNRVEVREFLGTRRAKLTPDQAVSRSAGSAVAFPACVARRSLSLPG